MNVLIVAYDVKDDDARQRLRDAITRFDSYFEHIELSVYLLASNEGAIDIRDRLRPLIGDDDRLYVGVISKSAWSGVPGLSDWSKDARSR